jgi:hypothetical protein
MKFKASHGHFFINSRTSNSRIQTYKDFPDLDFFLNSITFKDIFPLIQGPIQTYKDFPDLDFFLNSMTFKDIFP